MTRFKAIFKNQKIQLFALSMLFVLLVAGYGVILFFGAFPKKAEPEGVQYTINMYVTP